MPRLRVQRLQYGERQRTCRCLGESSFRAGDLDVHMYACTCWRTRACDRGGIQDERAHFSLSIHGSKHPKHMHARPAFNNHSTCMNLSRSYPLPHHMQRNGHLHVHLRHQVTSIILVQSPAENPAFASDELHQLCFLELHNEMPSVSLRTRDRQRGSGRPQQRQVAANDNNSLDTTTTSPNRMHREVLLPLNPVSAC